MTASLLVVTLTILGWMPLSEPAAPASPAEGDVPKTVILGFDGMDFRLTRQFIDEGWLPNFKRLAEQGGFGPLETSNPAQSPVSWAVVNTGSNPGKTGVAGFVSRHFVDFGPPGAPMFKAMPHPMLGDPIRVPADKHVRFPMALGNRLGFLLIVGGGAFLIGLLLFKLLFGMALPLAFVIALLVGGGAGWWAHSYAEGLPPDGQLPYVVNPMQGVNFWDHLDAQGVRMRGIQVASTYPPDREGPNTQLLSGLGLPDIGGSNGTFYVYTNNPWKFPKGTDNGGEIIKLWDDEPGVFESVVNGPRNWFEKARFDNARAILDAEKDNPRLSTDELAAIDKRLKDLATEEKRWKGRGEKVTVPVTMRSDPSAGTVTFVVQGRSETVPVGGWTDYLDVDFGLGGKFTAHGLVRFHVIRCDDEVVHIFTPPICIDPREPPEWLPISSPPDFAPRLAAMIGQPFETLGWGCMANPLKDIEDTEFSAQSFLDDTEENCSWRGKILAKSLESPDEWDVYYQVWGDTDRVAHMLFREFDPEHPLRNPDHPGHKPGYHETQVEMFGETFPLSEAIQHIYKEADRLVGTVLDTMESGALGNDPLLMIISDHGFTSWRRSINLNNLLADLGYLKLKGADTVEEYLASGEPTNLLNYVDWTQTQAYSMGLGKVFINLKGREPDGFVEPDDYDAVIEAIRADLLEVTDENGVKLVTSCSRRDELFDGPWWREGTLMRRESGRDVPYENAGFADLFMGYTPYHRVAGSNTMGDLAKAAVTDNEGHWSGDHVSVDPSHVQGVLFTSKRQSETRRAGLEDVAPTVLLRYGIDPTKTEMDGSAIRFSDS